MYERLTDRARTVIKLANQEAQRLKHEYLGTEHILLGLSAEGHGVGSAVLNNLDIDLGKLRIEVEKLRPRHIEITPGARMPPTPRAKKVIEYAIDEAKNLRHHYVGTEHLLLALVREQESVAAVVLKSLGVKLADVRKEVLNILGHPAG